MFTALLAKVAWQAGIWTGQKQRSSTESGCWTSSYHTSCLGPPTGTSCPCSTRICICTGRNSSQICQVLQRPEVCPQPWGSHRRPTASQRPEDNIGPEYYLHREADWAGLLGSQPRPSEWHRDWTRGSAFICHSYYYKLHSTVKR